MVYLAAGDSRCFTCCCICTQKAKEAPRVASWGAKQSNALSPFVGTILGWGAKLPQMPALMPRDSRKEPQTEHVAHA